jgi:hypothetical protein
MNTFLRGACALGAAIFPWLCAGCIGPHYHQHQLVLFGKQPPVINGPHDPAIERNLTTQPWPRSIVGSVTGVGVVLFKSAGIQGWHDFKLHALAEGDVITHQSSSSGFLTWDLRLHSLTVDDVAIPIEGTKYMRVEIFRGQVTVDKGIFRQTNRWAVAEGKLAWDTDGWFEIHPQKTGDVRFGPEK